jgi:hypothetical protein
MKKLITCITLVLGSAIGYATDPIPNPYGLAPGKPEIKSVGAMTFGPDGILFVADTKGASVFAFDVKDNVKDTVSTAIEVKNIDKTLSSFLGIASEDLTIHDMVVHPNSQAVYLTVSVGKSVDAKPVIIRINRNKELSELKMDNIWFAKSDINNAPAEEEKTPWGQPKRPMAITDLSFLDGTLYVAGLSNEQFSSRLRRLSFPFKANPVDNSVEVFHTSHNRFETNSPIETLLPVTLNNQSYVLAGYGCAPLAKFSVAELNSATHVKGQTLAELGGGSRPLDMILYKRKGQDHVLIANSNRSVYKMKVSDLEKSQPLTKAVDDVYVSDGTPYVATGYVGVMHIDNLNKNFVVAIQRDIQSGALNLVSLPKRWL